MDDFVYNFGAYMLDTAAIKRIIGVRKGAWMFFSLTPEKYCVKIA